MHHALAIANTPADTWADQLARIPEVCANPERCGQPHNCRERNADYLRLQWRMKSKREQGKARRA